MTKEKFLEWYNSKDWWKANEDDLYDLYLTLHVKGVDHETIIHTFESLEGIMAAEYGN